MKKFQDFLISEEYKEADDDPKFEVGDEVFVRGRVGFHEFNDVKGIIIKKRLGATYYQRTNRRTNYHHELEDNSYYGNVYYIEPIKYWVPPYVLTKINPDEVEQPRIRWYKKGELKRDD